MNNDINQWCINNRNKLLQNTTNAEQELYNYLPKRIKEYAICQYPIKVDGRIFFADIYVKEWNYIIEIDGGYHKTQEQSVKDDERTKLINRLGISVYRIPNEEVYDIIKLKKFVNMLLGLRKHKSFVKKKNIIKKIDVDKSRYKGVEKFRQDCDKFASLIGNKMIESKKDEQTYSITFLSFDGKYRIIIWTTTMTYQIAKIGVKCKSFKHQPIGVLLKMVNFILTSPSDKEFIRWVNNLRKYINPTQ